MSRNSLPAVELWERKRVGTILRAIREARGISPDSLASAVDRSRPFIANIEAGRKRIPSELIPKIIEALSQDGRPPIDPIVFAKAGAMTVDAA